MWSYFESIDLEDGSSEERKAIVAVFKLVADIGCADSGFADKRAVADLSLNRHGNPVRVKLYFHSI